MSKTSSRKRKSRPPRKPAPRRKAAVETVDEYLAKVPQPGRDALLEMRAAIRSTVPADAIETISYRIPAFRTKTGVLV